MYTFKKLEALHELLANLTLATCKSQVCQPSRIHLLDKTFATDIEKAFVHVKLDSSYRKNTRIQQYQLGKLRM